jgi:hypothetical protein
VFKTITLFAKVLLPFGASSLRARLGTSRRSVATGGARSIDENEAKVAAGALSTNWTWTRMARRLKRSFRDALPKCNSAKRKAAGIWSRTQP